MEKAWVWDRPLKALWVLTLASFKSCCIALSDLVIHLANHGVDVGLKDGFAARLFLLNYWLLSNDDNLQTPSHEDFQLTIDLFIDYSRSVRHLWMLQLDKLQLGKYVELLDQVL